MKKRARNVKEYFISVCSKEYLVKQFGPNNNKQITLLSTLLVRGLVIDFSGTYLTMINIF